MVTNRLLEYFTYPQETTSLIRKQKQTSVPQSHFRQQSSVTVHVVMSIYLLSTGNPMSLAFLKKHRTWQITLIRFQSEVSYDIHDIFLFFK